MGLFNRKRNDSQQPSSPHPAKPYIVDDFLDLSRQPSVVRLTWSDGRVDYVKPGDAYPTR
ncbi:hypothetical protein ABZ439_11505 [Streptomyces sp. NPDC005840]|uniref:hypothetical protein n=1 Tax=Streptomyces sp. NPDC005840 TaxID=3157072 RepID=UPI0033F3C0F3